MGFFIRALTQAEAALAREAFGAALRLDTVRLIGWPFRRAFVAGRWASPFWQLWDLTMLWLAGLHGGNGMRTVISDYSRKDSTRFWLKMVLYASVLLTVGLGTYVIFTFDPSISS